MVNDPESILAPKTVDKLKSNSSVQALTELAGSRATAGETLDYSQFARPNPYSATGDQQSAGGFGAGYAGRSGLLN